MSESAPRISELMKHSAWVRGLARALVLDAADADDVVQDTWVEVLRNPPRGVRRPRRKLLADQAYMGGFAVPLATGEGLKTESVGVTFVLPGER